MNRPSVQRSIWFVLLVVAGAFYAAGLTSGDGAPKTPTERAYAIKETTLCPICDGQNVLESNASIATSIRAQIDEWVAAGFTDAEIRAKLAAKFEGDINAIPPRTGIGSLVWIVPVAVAIIAAGGLVLSVRRWRMTTAARAAAADVALVAAARRDR